jgi:hypothetical protein
MRKFDGFIESLKITLFKYLIISQMSHVRLISKKSKEISSIHSQHLLTSILNKIEQMRRNFFSHQLINLNQIFFLFSRECPVTFSRQFSYSTTSGWNRCWILSFMFSKFWSSFGRKSDISFERNQFHYFLFFSITNKYPLHFEDFSVL